MKKYTIKVSPYARMQLREIREYIVVQLMNPGAAKVLLINMRKQISKLQDMPGRFKTIDVDPWGKQGVRKMIVGNYNVYY